MEFDRDDAAFRGDPDYYRAVASWASWIADDLREVMQFIEKQLELDGATPSQRLLDLRNAKDAADRALELAERLKALIAGDPLRGAD